MCNPSVTEPNSSSTSDLLDQLAPGVVLAGRYSLKDRVPRWISERRFKAREMESGDIVAVLVWQGSVPWIAEFIELSESLSIKPFRAVEPLKGGWMIVTDWVPGMRELQGDAETAQEVLDELKKFMRRDRSKLPPLRLRREAGEGVSEIAPPLPVRQRTAPIVEAAPAPRGNPLLDWLGFGIALAVAVIVGGFTLQWIQAVSEPLPMEKREQIGLPKPKSAPPKKASESSQLIEAQNLRKNGNATAALALLLDLDARSPENLEIQAETNSLLKSLDPDLENLRAGVRPDLVRSIDRAAESGNAEAIRLREAIQAPPEN